MAAHGARRLLPMADNAAAVIGIELLAAAQGCDFHAPLPSSAPLEAVRGAAARARCRTLDDDRYFHPDMQKAIALVRSGAVMRRRGRYSRHGRPAQLRATTLDRQWTP